MAQRASRNVLLITADQWRGDSLSCLDHPCVKTPNLDALAAESLLFRNHYSVCAPCGPARASLLTGMYLQNHRSVRNGTPLDARHGNLALELREAGYDPVLFGYTDTSLDPRYHDPEEVTRHGYENVLPGFRPEILLPESNPEPWYAFLEANGYELPANRYEIYDPLPDYPGAEGRGRTFAPPAYAAEHSQTAFLTQGVLDYLSRQSEGWFVHLSYLRPHPPFCAPEPYNRLYDPESVPPPRRAASIAEQAAQHPWLAAALGARGDWFDPWLRPVREGDDYDRELRQVRATYYGLISEVDHYLGVLFAALKASGAYDKTLIIFTSDHGELLGDRWLFGKRGYFDAAYHIPLIVRDPDAAADGARGRQLDVFTESVDIKPTILEWLDRDAPRQCDGASLLSFCHGRSPSGWRDEVHWEYDFREVDDPSLEHALEIPMDHCALNVIRDRRFKYVHFAALPPLLFDLENDPDEARDLAEDPAYAPQRMEMMGRLLSWRMANDERTLTGLKVTKDGVRERR